MVATDDRRQDEQLVHDIFAAISAGDEAALGELVTDDFVSHMGVLGDVVGRDAFLEVIRGWRSAFSDFTTRPEVVLIDGDMAAWRVTGTGTHTGEFNGIPPTGRTVTFSGIDMGRRRDGRACEHWAGNDMFGLLVQLGVIPMPAPTPVG